MPRITATRQDWIDLGLRRFGEAGPAGLVVERLARELGTSKAGFYWYFGGRSAYLAAVLDAWEQATTDALVLDAPFEHFAHAVYTSRQHVDVEWQLRRHRKHDATIDARLLAVDARRLAHIEQLLRDDGVVDAPVLAAVLYDQFIGWSSRHPDATSGDVRRQLTIVAALVDRFTPG